MSEKKEYIGIFRTSDVKINGKDYIAKIPAGGSELYTRAEAIEKMAKVICRTAGEDCETCGFNGNEKGCKRYLEFGNYITLAEAALNALLGVNNERQI